MLKAQELRQLGEKELTEEMQKISRELLKLKMDLQGGYAKESHQAKMMKRYIARMKTIQKEQSLKAQRAHGASAQARALPETELTIKN